MEDLQRPIDPDPVRAVVRMGLGKGFLPSLWFISGVLEVVFSPGSAVAWILLVVATIYLILKMFENLLSGNIGLVLGILTAMLWLVSLFLLF
jgi:hypothetical protein